MKKTDINRMGDREYMRKRNSNNAMVRTVFNNTHEATFNPVKTFYCFINFDGKDHVFTYEGKFRSVAEKHFATEAKKYSGTASKVYSLRK